MRSEEQSRQGRYRIEETSIRETRSRAGRGGSTCASRDGGARMSREPRQQARAGDSWACEQGVEATRATHE
jgi:hypothetical protein